MSSNNGIVQQEHKRFQLRNSFSDHTIDKILDYVERFFKSRDEAIK